MIVDIAAERGGNCELTRPGETVEHGGVRILGPLNLASTIRTTPARCTPRNIATFLKYLIKDGSGASTGKTRSCAKRWSRTRAKWSIRECGSIVGTRRAEQAV